MTDSVKIYLSYYDSIKKLPESERLAMWDAIMEYSFYGTIPKLDGVMDLVWGLIKPNLDASILSYNNGKNGGKKSGKLRGVPKGGSEGGFRTDVDVDVDNTSITTERTNGGKKPPIVPLSEEDKKRQKWKAYPLPPLGAKKITEKECIALLQIPYPNRTSEQNGLVYEYTHRHPEFNSDIYKL